MVAKLSWKKIGSLVVKNGIAGGANLKNIYDQTGVEMKLLKDAVSDQVPAPSRTRNQRNIKGLAETEENCYIWQHVVTSCCSFAE